MTNIEEAIQRIEESKRLAGVSLNLEGLELTTQNLEQLIPIIAYKLPNLSYLYLDSNNITSLPENIGMLGELLDLNCSNNELKSLSGIEKFTNLSRLFLRNNFISMVPDSVVSLPDLNHVVLSKNPLSLISLLNISTIENSQQKFLLNSEHTNTLGQLLEQPRVQNLATSVAVDYPAIPIEQFNILYQSLNTDHPDISIEQLNTLYQSLSATEVQGLAEFDLSLSELGIVLDSNGNISQELSLRHTNAELSELLDKTAAIKEITGKTSPKAFRFVKNKSAIYLDGILNYGLSEAQMNQVDSDEKIKAVYQRINEKISEKHSSEEKEQNLTNSTDEHKERDLANLNDGDKDLARAIFDSIIGTYISEQSTIENNDEAEQKQAASSYASISSEYNSPNGDHLDLSALRAALNSSQPNLGSGSSSSSNNDSVSGVKQKATPRVRPQKKGPK